LLPRVIDQNDTAAAFAAAVSKIHFKRNNLWKNIKLQI
jgi:hypothetical protein